LPSQTHRSILDSSNGIANRGKPGCIINLMGAIAQYYGSTRPDLSSVATCQNAENPICLGRLLDRCQR
jgi:hypothetical protein